MDKPFNYYLIWGREILRFDNFSEADAHYTAMREQGKRPTFRITTEYLPSNRPGKVKVHG